MYKAVVQPVQPEAAGVPVPEPTESTGKKVLDGAITGVETVAKGTYEGSQLAVDKGVQVLQQIPFTKTLPGWAQYGISICVFLSVVCIGDV